MSEHPILCFGEVLWDCLPAGLFLGGAPMNVAYHLTRFGRATAPVSATGRDFLGDEALRRITAWGVDTRFLVQVADHPTGVVQVELADGQPSYTIVEDVAWDAIPRSDALLEAAAAAPALVFGTLASRGERNRDLLRELLTACPGLTACDANFRPPFDDHDLVWDLAPRCDLIKLNDEELRALLPDQEGGLDDLARHFVERARCQRLCVTAGSAGAGLLEDGHWYWAEGRRITVRDTVGAGDSFMAALIDGLLRDADRDAILTRAARLAEFVASSDGATPDHADAPSEARDLPPG